MAGYNDKGLTMKYFVLRPSGKDIHAQASREAILTYADVVQFDNPRIAHELRGWVKAEGNS